MNDMSRSQPNTYVREFLLILAMAAALYFILWAAMGFSQMIIMLSKWLSTISASVLVHCATLTAGAAVICYLLLIALLLPGAFF
jgi:hypothetical protein